MSDQEFGSTPSGHESSQGPAAEETKWGPPQPNNYTQPQYPPPPPGYAPPPAAATGLSDNAASALAYVTFIPAIIFLVMPPYNQKPIIKFHSIQEIGISVVAFVLHVFVIIPILGWLVYVVGMVGLLILWVLCIMKASQGGAFKLPFLGDFAAQQSGYKI